MHWLPQRVVDVCPMAEIGPARSDGSQPSPSRHARRWGPGSPAEEPQRALLQQPLTRPLLLQLHRGRRPPAVGLRSRGVLPLRSRLLNRLRRSTRCASLEACFCQQQHRTPWQESGRKLRPEASQSVVPDPRPPPQAHTEAKPPSLSPCAALAAGPKQRGGAQPRVGVRPCAETRACS